MNSAHRPGPKTKSDLTDLLLFLEIARHRNFRRAGLDLGITASAVSHALKGFEARMGVRLVNRTNRSVTLTAAGEVLLAAITAPFGQIDAALGALDRYRDRPGGKIRINAVMDAAPVVLGPVLAELALRYPEVEVDLVLSNKLVDVVGEGFDAGIRYGGTVPEDMIAQRLSPDLRWVVAAAPGYLERHGLPAHPDALRDHRCLGVRLGNDRIYQWEFAGPDGEFSVAVPGAITADDSRATLAMALRGAGLTYGLEAIFAPYLAVGALRLVLPEWAVTGPGFHLYYSSRHQVPSGLRALVEIARELGAAS